MFEQQAADEPFSVPKHLEQGLFTISSYLHHTMPNVKLQKNNMNVACFIHLPNEPLTHQLTWNWEQSLFPKSFEMMQFVDMIIRW